MIMQVHDELVFEVREGEVEPVREQICRLMSEAAELVNAAAGRSRRWQQLGRGALARPTKSMNRNDRTPCPH
jgi:hypothetical protein